MTNKEVLEKGEKSNIKKQVRKLENQIVKKEKKLKKRVGLAEEEIKGDKS